MRKEHPAGLFICDYILTLLLVHLEPIQVDQLDCLPHTPEQLASSHPMD